MNPGVRAWPKQPGVLTVVTKVYAPISRNISRVGTLFHTPWRRRLTLLYSFSRGIIRLVNTQEAKKKVMAEFIEEERRRDEALAKQVQHVVYCARCPNSVFHHLTLALPAGRTYVRTYLHIHTHTHTYIRTRQPQQQ